MVVIGSLLVDIFFTVSIGELDAKYPNCWFSQQKPKENESMFFFRPPINTHLGLSVNGDSQKGWFPFGFHLTPANRVSSIYTTYLGSSQRKTQRKPIILGVETPVNTPHHLSDEEPSALSQAGDHRCCGGPCQARSLRKQRNSHESPFPVPFPDDPWFQ